MTDSHVRAFTALERLSRRWRRGGVDVRAAMAEMLAACRAMHRRGPWEGLLAVDWGADRAAIVRWLSDQLDAYPPPPRVRGLWFGAPEIEYSEPRMWVVGSEGFELKNTERASRMVWPGESVLRMPPKKRRAPIDVRLTALNAAQRLLRLQPGRELNERDLESAGFFAYILPLAYGTALLGDVLPLVWPRLMLGKARRRGVACGFQSGDGVTMGWLGGEGWER